MRKFFVLGPILAISVAGLSAAYLLHRRRGAVKQEEGSLSMLSSSPAQQEASPSLQPQLMHRGVTLPLAEFTRC